MAEHRATAIDADQQAWWLVWPNGGWSWIGRGVGSFNDAVKVSLGVQPRKHQTDEQETIMLRQVAVENLNRTWHKEAPCWRS